jgi:hypothetical protein
MLRRTRRNHISQEEKQARLRAETLAAAERQRLREAEEAADSKRKPVIKVEDDLEGMPVIQPEEQPTATAEPEKVDKPKIQAIPVIQPMKKGRQILESHAKKNSKKAPATTRTKRRAKAGNAHGSPEPAAGSL